MTAVGRSLSIRGFRARRILKGMAVQEGLSAGPRKPPDE
jgi:hypothetical protein